LSGHGDTGSGRFHLLTLAFRDAALEQRYRIDAAPTALILVRLGLVASIAVWLAGAAVLPMIGGQRSDEAIALILRLMVPYLVVMLLATRWLKTVAWLELLAGSGNVLAGVMVSQVSWMMGMQERYALPGHILVTVFAFFVFRMRFLSAFACGVIYTAVFVVRAATMANFAFDMFLLGSAVGMVAVAAYMLEKALRNAYYERNELQLAHRALHDAQAQLVQSEKMASLGFFNDTATTEIYTPLGAIRSTNQSVEKASEKLRGALADHPAALDEKKVKGSLRVLDNASKTIGEGAERVDVIVRRLRSFARLDEAELQDVDVDEIVADALSLLEHQLGPKVTLRRDLAELPPLRCYPAELNQLVMNVVLNAIEAAGDEGRVTVRTVLHDEQVVIAVEDDGAGIADEHIEQVFDPGFTTKGVGVGAGLGLAICYRIAERHGGRIDVKSEEGKGSSFTITLPLSGPPPASTAASSR
jgi:signal transduction histidine kinase